MWCPAIIDFGKSDVSIRETLEKASSVHILPVLLGLVAH